MPAALRTIYLIAGCNGAGKTTFAKEFLPNEVKCLRFYNADEIARGLSPLDPNAGAIKAGRLLLREVHTSIERRETFAVETTLAASHMCEFLGARFRQDSRLNFTIYGLRDLSRPWLVFVSLHPYFKVPPDKLEMLKAVVPEFVAKTRAETQNLFYEFTINGDEVFCREGYLNAEALLVHLGNVSAMLEAALKMAELIRLEVHGPAAELEKLKEPLAHLNPAWFTLVAT